MSLWCGGANIARGFACLEIGAGLVIAELSTSSDSNQSQPQLVSTQQMVGIQQG